MKKRIIHISVKGFLWTLIFHTSIYLKRELKGRYSLQINAGEGVEKREPSYNVGGNVTCCSPLQRTVWRFLKKLKTELPYDLAIPLLGIYLKKTLIPKDTCTPVFIAALFTIAKTWNQPKCPSTDEWRKMWYAHTCTHTIWNDGIVLSHYKSEMLSSAVTWMDPEIITLGLH